MALDNTKLAGTIARTAPSIGIYLFTATGEKRIGAVNRGGVRRFELDAAIPGRTVEIIPGKIETLDLTIKRAMLYSGDMMEAFGFTSVTDLVEQNIPIEVREYRYAKPTFVNGVMTETNTGTTQCVKYLGCYFMSNPQTVDVDGDWQIIQEATLMVSNVVCTDGPTNPA
jgi:hypothetical protein